MLAGRQYFFDKTNVNQRYIALPKEIGCCGSSHKGIPIQKERVWSGKLSFTLKNYCDKIEIRYYISVLARWYLWYFKRVKYYITIVLWLNYFTININKSLH